ncbi:MAG: hypothetical protein GY903_32265 [Fuerstiella sp.]|nr:hypothetical protein [Fuerstiella sp.]MCP4859167.1 hypothetical protein [Fuerstiella sp.]
MTLPPYHADPCGEEDSALAFRRAIDAVGKLGSGLVYVPAGVYKVQGTILLNRDKVVIQGETSTPAMTITTGGCRPSISTTFVACPSCDKSGRLIAVRLRRRLPHRCSDRTAKSHEQRGSWVLQTDYAITAATCPHTTCCDVCSSTTPSPKKF